MRNRHASAPATGRASHNSPRARHPIADEIGDGYAAYWIRSGDASLTGPLAAFLEFCRIDDYRPVLVTEQAAYLSSALVRACQEYAVYWAFQAPDGVVYNGHTGWSIRSFPELWEGPSQPDGVWGNALYQPKTTRASAALTIDLCARPSPGSVPEPLSLAVATMAGFAVSPSTVGPAEPCLAPWDRDVLLTEFNDNEHQRTQGLIVQHTGPGSLTVDDRIGPDGVYERVRGTFDLGRRYDSVTFSIVRKAEAILRQLAEAFPLTSGIINLIETASSGRRCAGAVADPLPLTVCAGTALAEAQSETLEASLSKFHAHKITSPGSGGYLLSQSMDVGEFASIAHQLTQADPVPEWTSTGDTSRHAL